MSPTAGSKVPGPGFDLFLFLEDFALSLRLGFVKSLSRLNIQLWVSLVDFGLELFGLSSWSFVQVKKLSLFGVDGTQACLAERFPRKETECGLVDGTQACTWAPSV